MKPRLRTAYSVISDPKVGTTNSLPTRTVQADAGEVDLNILMRRAAINGGMIPGVQMPPPIEAFEEVFDFQTAMNVIRASNEAFAALPAAMRNRFNNDPKLYIDFVSDPDNLEEMVKLGIAKKIDPPKPPDPVSVRVVNPDPPAPAK